MSVAERVNATAAMPSRDVQSVRDALGVVRSVATQMYIRRRRHHLTRKRRLIAPCPRARESPSSAPAHGDAPARRRSLRRCRANDHEHALRHAPFIRYRHQHGAATHARIEHFPKKLRRIVHVFEHLHAHAKIVRALDAPASWDRGVDAVVRCRSDRPRSVSPVGVRVPGVIRRDARLLRYPRHASHERVRPWPLQNRRRISPKLRAPPKTPSRNTAILLFVPFGTERVQLTHITLAFPPPVSDRDDVRPRPSSSVSPSRSPPPPRPFRVENHVARRHRPHAIAVHRPPSSHERRTFYTPLSPSLRGRARPRAKCRPRMTVAVCVCVDAQTHGGTGLVTQWAQGHDTFARAGRPARDVSAR